MVHTLKQTMFFYLVVNPTKATSLQIQSFERVQL